MKTKHIERQRSTTTTTTNLYFNGFILICITARPVARIEVLGWLSKLLGWRRFQFIKIVVQCEIVFDSQNFFSKDFVIVDASASEARERKFFYVVCLKIQHMNIYFYLLGIKSRALYLMAVRIFFCSCNFNSLKHVFCSCGFELSFNGYIFQQIISMLTTTTESGFGDLAFLSYYYRSP